MGLKPLPLTPEGWTQKFFQPLKQAWKNSYHQKHPALFCALYLESYFKCTPHRGQWAAPLPKPICQDEHLLPPLLRPWNKRLLKGLPYHIHESLILWYHKSWPIHLTFVSPAPEEILYLQARGERVVTAYLSIEDFKLFVTNQRFDPGIYLIHDLKHAWEFFYYPASTQCQTLIYQWLWNFYQENKETKFIQDKEFAYLISDINTHPIHLLKTWKHWAKSHGYEDLFNQFLEKHQNEAREDIRKLNTPLENQAVHERIMEILRQKASDMPKQKCVSNRL